MPIKQMNESPLGLQNLAWLGEDGKVHTVKQPENGPRLIGSSAPRFSPEDLNIPITIADCTKGPCLQNLAWLDADGNVQTVAQPNDGTRLLGATRPDGLQNLDLADAYLAWNKKVLNYANSPEARNAYTQWYDDNINIANNLARGQNKEGFHGIADAGIHALGAFKDFVDTPAEYDLSPAFLI